MSDYMDGVRGVLDGHGARSCECGTDLAVTLAPAIAKVRADAKAEALREAAAIVDAHADKNERNAVNLYFRTQSNTSGGYREVGRSRIIARWLRARADNLEAPDASNP